MVIGGGRQAEEAHQREVRKEGLVGRDAGDFVFEMTVVPVGLVGVVAAVEGLGRPFHHHHFGLAEVAGRVEGSPA